MTARAIPNDAYHRPTLDAHAVAALTGRSADAVKMLRLRGRGPRYYKIDEKLVRYSLADVDAWLTASPVDTAA
ncbi:AlpA family transcriptional regulator [Rhodococcus sp. 11-3]|uniref:helix-turn-helix transcriptional regulator n=1 Tax=Rhodococcus sp. 11-3 TaxID=2854796 RepID=UPI00203B4F3C|nr:hypothetical protein [Rhodococcus sp. 11-3]USC18469.1 hypothetical protein KZJ41_28255 [Rhodococcus sp. 11-3]